MEVKKRNFMNFLVWGIFYLDVRRTRLIYEDYSVFYFLVYEIWEILKQRIGKSIILHKETLANSCGNKWNSNGNSSRWPIEVTEVLGVGFNHLLKRIYLKGAR